ncbi:hypothetical protein COLO4_26579 [Corchorus olitorius]|uniref:Uncharacterized protein n=1 Tax=Corchorus olitorius TaxID=93759 RepID=A0A1R3HWF1_9ROSI|nr:hypothetical protein COLO4_26579 [Corchorus olitorius]
MAPRYLADAWRVRAGLGWPGGLCICLILGFVSENGL